LKFTPGGGTPPLKRKVELEICDSLNWGAAVLRPYMIAMRISFSQADVIAVRA
jgi:hypothetical protein